MSDTGGAPPIPLDPDAAAAPAAACANCDAPLEGRFCAVCGQEAKPLDPPIRHFAKEFAQELLDVDGRLLRSFRRLLFSPGFLTREHVEGRRAPWLSPLKLYLLASVAMFGLQAFVAGGPIRFTTSDDAEAVRQSLGRMGYASLEELRDAVEAARQAWVPRVLFVLVPFFAALVALFERRARRRYPSHLVFALHVHAAGFIARAVAAAASIGFPAWSDGFGQVASIWTVGYLFLAFRSSYGDSRSRAALQTAAISVVYVLAIVTATVAVVAVAMFGREWMRAFGS